MISLNGESGRGEKVDYKIVFIRYVHQGKVFEGKRAVVGDRMKG